MYAFDDLTLDPPGGGGFTILEIMIATAILTVGLVSVLALFPVAIDTGKKVMDSSNAVVIAESVAEAVREGIRNQLRAVDRSDGADRYFIFKHDGVRDPVPNDRRLERPDKDYYILLPRYPDGARGTFSGATEEIRRESSIKVGKVFVYPETDPSPGGGGHALRADDDGDDYTGALSTGQTYRDFVVEEVYPLGSVLPSETASGIDVLEDQQIETLKQYSFAIAVRVSKYDANRSQNDRQYKPANRLFHFHILIFRNFFRPAPRERHQDPVFELDFEVAL